MREFEDRPSMGPGDSHPAHHSEDDADWGMGMPRDRHEVCHQRIVPSAANFDAGYRARRSDRPWASRACRIPTWRAAAHGRGLAS